MAQWLHGLAEYRITALATLRLQFSLSHHLHEKYSGHVHLSLLAVVGLNGFNPDLFTNGYIFWGSVTSHEKFAPYIAFSPRVRSSIPFTTKIHHVYLIMH